MLHGRTVFLAKGDDPVIARTMSDAPWGNARCNHPQASSCRTQWNEPKVDMLPTDTGRTVAPWRLGNDVFVAGYLVWAGPFWTSDVEHQTVPTEH